jgi:hypothetical protein
MTAQNSSKVYDIQSGKGANTSTQMIQVFGVSRHENDAIGYATRYSSTPESRSARIVHLERCKHTEVVMVTLSAPCTQLSAAIALNECVHEMEQFTENHVAAIQRFIAKHNARDISAAQEFNTAHNIHVRTL